MFNGNLISMLLKEQRKQVGEMITFVFGGKSHISKSYFKDRTFIDSRYLEKLSEFFIYLFRISFSLMRNLKIERVKRMFITSPIRRSISTQARRYYLV